LLSTNYQLIVWTSSIINPIFSSLYTFAIIQYTSSVLISTYSIYLWMTFLATISAISSILSF